MNAQDWIALSIVAVAALFLLGRFLGLGRNKEGGCHGCGSCSCNDAAPTVVTIDPIGQPPQRPAGSS